MRVFFVCVLFSFEHIIVFVVCDVWCGAFFSFLFFVCVWACVGLCEFRLSFRCLCVLFVIYGAMLFVCLFFWGGGSLRLCFVACCWHVLHAFGCFVCNVLCEVAWYLLFVLLCVCVRV